MKSFYALAHIESDLLGVGYAPSDCGFDLLGEGKYGEGWETVTFILEDGGFADYQINDMGWPLCSERLKEIIESFRAPEDTLEWLDATVITAGGEARKYYILNLPIRSDVLDRKKTIFAKGGFVVKPYYSLKNINGRRIFSYPSGEFTVIISDEVKNAIASANCTGIDFLKVPVSSD